MIYRIGILTLSLTLFPLVAICQVQFEFEKKINIEGVGQKRIEVGSDSTIFETIYLGELKMKEESETSKKVFYHVFSQFYSVPTAIARHGHSRVVFLDEHGIVVREYLLDMPNELPKSITENNELEFRTGIVKYLSLPEVLCIPKGGCYE